jgi:AraC-like DNA-binding protein
MVRFSYVVKDYEKFINDWGRFLKVKPNNHLLLFPSVVGKGYFYGKIMNEAMSFLVVNVKFNQPLIVDREPLDDTGLILQFLQTDYRGKCELSTDVDNVRYHGNVKQRCVFLSSPNYPLRINYSKGTYMRCIAVYFKAPLLHKFLKKDILYHLQEFSKMRLKGLDKRSITVDENKLLHDIFNADIQSSFGKLVLYNRVLLLIEKMIRRFLLTKLPASKTERLKEKDMDGLKEVEFALSEKDLEKFPSVKELSRIALMSTTKLKKRFKEVYGMKLYEFYNYNRLSNARQSIESGESTIKDAAYRAGYSNLSNFSKAFKKEFGLSPSQVKPE